MNPTFHFVLKSPLEILFDGEVKSITFSSEEEGATQVFSGYASFTGSLLFSALKIVVSDTHSEEYLVRSGLFLFDNANNSASMLVLHGEKKEEVDMQTVTEYLAYIQKQLDEGGDLSEFQVKYLEGERIALERQIGE